MNRTLLGLMCVFCVLVSTFSGINSRAENGVITFEGDQSEGIEVTHSTSPSSHDIHTVEVIRLQEEIRPAPGVKGIYLQNTTGENAIIHSGSSQEIIPIYTDGASGIVTEASGTPTGPFPKDSFLNVPLISEDPAVPGGQAEVVSYSDIHTEGDDSHGIWAYSASDGYPDSVINDLKNFKEEGFTFTV